MIVQIDKYTFRFQTEVLKILQSHIQHKAEDHERGGIILGRVFEGNIFEVSKLSIPTELDRSSRYNFERHRLSAQIIIEYEFYNSNQQLTYLGEWHTHPEDHPTPSSTDLKMIDTQFKENKFHTSCLMLLIQGIKSTFIGIKDKKGLYTTFI